VLGSDLLLPDQLFVYHRGVEAPSDEVVCSNPFRLLSVFTCLPPLFRGRLAYRPSSSGRPKFFTDDVSPGRFIFEEVIEFLSASSLLGATADEAPKRGLFSDRFDLLL